MKWAGRTRGAWSGRARRYVLRRSAFELWGRERAIKPSRLQSLGVAAISLSFVFLFAGCGGGSSGDTEIYEVPSESMEPAFSVGDELTVELDAYDDHDPEIGDVVVFHPF